MSDENHEYGLIRPFHIDDGQLDGLRRNECFTLGYELALIDEALRQPEPISKPVHAENADRIRWACDKAGREHRLNWSAGDVSEGWMQLEVEAASEIV